MRVKNRFCCSSPLALLSLATCAAPVWGQGVLTLQVGLPPPPPTPLVEHGDTWNFHQGTNAPQPSWQTIPDASLDSTWGSGAGGFGYADNFNETNGLGTAIADMQNRFTTLYIRRSFDVTNAVDPARHLLLTMDWDDAFVAYLDGVELGRANTTNAIGQEPRFDATAAGSHESSHGNTAPTNPPSLYDLGPVGSRLAPGTHVLALIGLNATPGSTDFILIPDLALAGAQRTVSGGTFFSLVTTNPVTLLGSNTLAASTAVVVNGMNATFDPAAGTWSKIQNLVPGMNRLFVAALDVNGNILASTNRDLVYEASSTSTGGTLSANTHWTSAMGIIHVTSDVVVPSGITLSMSEGLVVLLDSGVSIRATAGGVIDIAGTEANPDFFLPLDGTSVWGALNATGAGASLAARHIETAAGALTFNSGATGMVEDSYLHDRASIITAGGANFITLRRIHVNRYEETIFNSGTTILAEDSLYENMSAPNSDALEIQGGPPGSIVRRCTFRHATASNSDAVDFNGTSGATVESCLIRDFTDKGVSLGAAAAGGAADFGIIVSNCLIYRVDTGMAVKDSSTVGLYASTITKSVNGLRLYQKFSPPGGGGHITNALNNIIWDNTNSIVVSDGGTLMLDYSDIQGANWPGTGNISADPLFVSAGLDDFRLAPGSPAVGTGLAGTDMGVHFPIGGIPAGPLKLAAHAAGTNVIQVWWRDDADNEAGVAIERSTNGSSWQTLGAVGANVTNFTDGSALLDQLYFYRVRATNSSGVSPYSNLASAIRQVPMALVCGRLTANTVWTPAMGMILVCSNIMVPANVTLTLQAGTVVKLTNNASIMAQSGGAIRIEGTEANKVVVQRWNGANNWAELRADGRDAALLIRHADISGGQTTVYNGASALFEDSYFHDFHQQVAPIVLTHFPGSTTLRRCHIENYYEVLLRNGVHTVEDTLFERMTGDALDFDAAQPGTVVRRCTFRHGNLGNVDAIDVGNGDLGGSHDLVIEDCLMYDFPFDKGVSIGDAGQSSGITVRNCLIYGVLSGVQVKDDCFATVYNSTIVDNAWGFTNYNKVNPSLPTGGGHITNAHNNILWNNRTTISLWNGSTLTADHCDFGATNWPGTGNTNIDPQFLNPAERDYRLAANSPCLGIGRNGEDLGAHFPVGAPMALSHPRFESIAVTSNQVKLRFWVDPERSYTVQCRDLLTSGPWLKLADAVPGPLPYVAEVTDNLSASTRFYRLVSPRQP